MTMRIITAFVLAIMLAGCAAAPRPAPPVAQRAIALPAPVPLPPARTIADFVLVEKGARRLTLFSGGAAIRVYGGLQLGVPVGHKQFQGDRRTPEGRYLIDYRNPRSSYHLSLHISYPNAADRAYAHAHGRSPGGDIFIHGQPNGLAHGRMAGDWTDGCIALSNREMAELWAAIPDGTPIEIKP